MSSRRELIEERGCELLYLPPYSPELNPIEEAFSKIKGTLRSAEARTREALVEVMGAAISAVSARDASGFFEHCGYGTRVNHYMTNALYGRTLYTSMGGREDRLSDASKQR